MKEQHIVPLSEQALEVLKIARKYSPNEGKEGLVFPLINSSEKEMSDNTLSKALRDQGY